MIFVNYFTLFVLIEIHWLIVTSNCSLMQNSNTTQSRTLINNKFHTLTTVSFGSVNFVESFTVPEGVAFLSVSISGSRAPHAFDSGEACTGGNGAKVQTKLTVTAGNFFNFLKFNSQYFPTYFQARLCTYPSATKQTTTYREQTAAGMAVGMGAHIAALAVAERATSER